MPLSTAPATASTSRTRAASAAMPIAQGGASSLLRLGRPASSKLRLALRRKASARRRRP